MSYERKETKNGYICYVNKEKTDEIKQLDPGGLGNFIQEMIKSTSIDNAFYRCSGRLHLLRKYLKTINIPFNLILSILERHKFFSNDDVPAVKPNQVINLFYDVYYAANKLDFIQRDEKVKTDFGKEFDPDDKSIMLASLFWAIFDPNHCKFLSLLEIKLTLLILCSTNSIEELIQHQFHLSIDHNRCITKSKFKAVLIVLLKVLNFLDNSIFCDSETISEIVTNSFEKVNCTGLAGLNDSQFYEFWSKDKFDDSDFGYYLNVIVEARRMKSETVHELIPCDGNCKKEKIIGLRFKCQKCSKLNLCLDCFLGNFQSKKHHPESHKMLEMTSNAEEKRKSLLAKLLNVFYFMKFKRTVQINGNQEDSILEETITNDSGLGSCSMKDLNSTGKDKLFSIIELLSMENRVFQSNLEQIQKTCNPNTEFYGYLERHKNIITEQIDQLRLIWKRSSHIQEFMTPMPNTVQKFSSTPFRPNLRKINWDLLDLDTPATAVRSRIIRGEEINKTFFEANRSDRSLEDVSSWLHLRESFCREMSSLQGNLDNAWNANKIDGEMKSFRVLLNKVREILEDTYSDNNQLSTVTQQLESVLDKIIGEEEKKRLSQ